MPVHVEAQLSASVFRIEKAVGDAVAADEVLMLLESMKMEIPVEAPCAGRITEIRVAEGDAVGLVRDFEQVVDQKEAEEDAERILKGQFTMDDLLKQLRTIQKMGPLREVFARMHMFGGMADQVNEGELTKVESMIQSMTRQERRKPDLIDKAITRKNQILTATPDPLLDAAIVDAIKQRWQIAI